tara:strand:- start:1693 stop:2901 length:1209 start_codon:yes stop_codon:yes gene_type:complete
MSYGMKKVDRIIIGEKVTSRSAENAAQFFLQGTEINKIGMLRSGLPILGRNPRYKVVDNLLTSSLSDSNFFTDVGSTSDAGLGQDTYISQTGVLYNKPGYVVNGKIITDSKESSAVSTINQSLTRLGLKGTELTSSTKGRVRTFLETVSNEWEIGSSYIDGVLDDEVYYVAGTYKEISKARVKFPDGRLTHTISFALPNEDLGYGKEYIDSVPYFDLSKFNAVEYVKNNGPTGMFPIVGSFISYDEKLSFNGIIEPFEIRRRALGLSIFLEDEGQPGSVQAFNDPVITAFSFDSRENDIRAEFFEDVHSKGYSRFDNPMDQAHSLLEPEFVSDYNKNQYPFKERDNNDLLISDNGIKSIQLSMDPTLDEGTLPVTHVDMTVGFDAESRDRVNSIVFRGMTRR